MSKDRIWTIAKLLEGLGLVVILVGLVGSVRMGIGEEGFASMKMETYGLLIGGGLFLAGWLLERGAGTR